MPFLLLLPVSGHLSRGFVTLHAAADCLIVGTTLKQAKQTAIAIFG